MCSGARQESRSTCPMSEPSRPLRILIYADDVNVREQVNLALGKRLHPELPELT